MIFSKKGLKAFIEEQMWLAFDDESDSSQKLWTNIVKNVDL
jgi:hypothetical protein